MTGAEKEMYYPKQLGTRVSDKTYDWLEDNRTSSRSNFIREIIEKHIVDNGKSEILQEIKKMFEEGVLKVFRDKATDEQIKILEEL